MSLTVDIARIGVLNDYEAGSPNYLDVMVINAGATSFSGDLDEGMQFLVQHSNSPTPPDLLTSQDLPISALDLSLANGATFVLTTPDLYFTGHIETSTTALISVVIDIKPYSEANSINIGSAGVIPVAILGAVDFDVANVDPASVSLAGASVKLVGKSDKYLCHQDDVNLDGFIDLICQIYTAQFFIEAGETTAILEAVTFDGTKLRGEDVIRIVPNN